MRSSAGKLLLGLFCYALLLGARRRLQLGWSQKAPSLKEEGVNAARIRPHAIAATPPRAAGLRDAVLSHSTGSTRVSLIMMLTLPQ